MRRLATDTLIMAERNLVRLPRQPDLLSAFTIQPIMFVLLFVYVFGGAIDVSASGVDDYKDFLIPGIIVQNIAFGGFVTAIGLVEDLNKGLIDRFRSLPMARAALLAGRTFADVVTNFISMTILVVTGLIIGFSFDAGVGRHPARRVPAAPVRLRLLVGVRVPGDAGVHAGVGQRAGLHGGVPADVHLVGVRGARDACPTACSGSPRSNPFTVIVDEMRELWLGVPGGSLWQSLAWTLAITAVFAPLAVWRYRQSAERA